MIETSLTTPEEGGQVEGEDELDILLLYMKIRETELSEILDNNNTDYQIDVYLWWDRFNQDMNVLESTKKSIEEDFKLTYIRNRIELLLHLNFW